jgi:hypothetical protein
MAHQARHARAHARTQAGMQARAFAIRCCRRASRSTACCVRFSVSSWVKSRLCLSRSILAHGICRAAENFEQQFS